MMLLEKCLNRRDRGQMKTTEAAKYLKQGKTLITGVTVKTLYRLGEEGVEYGPCISCAKEQHWYPFGSIKDFKEQLNVLDFEVKEEWK
jgi:hypothetical protein